MCMQLNGIVVHPIHASEEVQYLGDEIGVRVCVAPQRRRGLSRVEEINVVPGMLSQLMM